MLKTDVLTNICVKIAITFSGLLDEWKVQKNIIYVFTDTLLIECIIAE